MAREKQPAKRVKSLEFNGTLRVTTPLEPVDTGYPYWRNKAKKPCDPATKGRNRCWKDSNKFEEYELEKYSEPACKAAGGIFEKASLRALDQGRVELDFISAAQAAKLGPSVKPGPILRLCHTSMTPGRLVQVKNPNDASDRAQTFRQCIEEQVPTVAKACATKLLGESAPLGGLGQTLDKYLVHIYRARGAGGGYAKVPIKSVEIFAASPNEASSMVYKTLEQHPRRRRATETYAVWRDGAWHRLGVGGMLGGMFRRR